MLNSSDVKPNTFQDFNNKVRANPRDAFALWGLYNCYQYGWGVSKNKQWAEYYLNKAATCGFSEAKELLARRAALQQAVLYRQELDRAEQHTAKLMFEQGKGLRGAIAREIFPALVSIRIMNGLIIGTGFFQHTNWLVSNAHIMPCKELVDSALLVDDQFHSIPLEAQSAYHRPSHRKDSPDIVIIKTASRHAQNRKCLPTQFSGDDGYAQHYFFYVDINSNSNQYEIKYLRRLSQPNTYPIIYQHEDETDPQPGCSGSPIIEARLLISREPEWQFRVVGALYARCSAEWYNHTPNKLTEHVAVDTKLVCAIPVIQEFSQVLAIIRHEENAIRARQMENACQHLGDAQAKRDAVRYQQRGIASEEEKQTAIKKFTRGDTPLNIALPDGLEKLWYRANPVVSIADSLMIEKVFNRQIGRKFRDKFFNVPVVELEDLDADFKAFINQISHLGEIQLAKRDNFLTSPAGYFRVDVGGGGNNKWILDIQDNTGRCHHNNQPLSSIFAKVFIPNTSATIRGADLAQLFNASQQEKMNKEYVANTAKKMAVNKKR